MPKDHPVYSSGSPGTLVFDTNFHRSTGNPIARASNETGVGKTDEKNRGDFRPINEQLYSPYITETIEDRYRPRKSHISHMGFRMIPISMTLNDRNAPCLFRGCAEVNKYRHISGKKIDPRAGLNSHAGEWPLWPDLFQGNDIVQLQISRKWNYNALYSRLI